MSLACTLMLSSSLQRRRAYGNIGTFYHALVYLLYAVCCTSIFCSACAVCQCPIIVCYVTSLNSHRGGCIKGEELSLLQAIVIAQETEVADKASIVEVIGKKKKRRLGLFQDTTELTLPDLEEAVWARSEQTLLPQMKVSLGTAAANFKQRTDFFGSCPQLQTALLPPK